VSVLGAFESTWSNARSTFGQGSPVTGERYDNSSSLRQMQSDLGSAAPGPRWTGAAATAYDAVNTEHRRVFGQLTSLDQRLKSHVGDSAAFVAAGRSNLDSVRQWVAAAASSLPPGQAGEQMKLAIAQKGIAGVIDVLTKSNGDLTAIGERLRGLGAEYDALKEQKFGKGDIAMYAGGGEGAGDGGKKDWKPDTPYEEALREAGMLDEEPTGNYQEWLQNAARQNVPPETIADIAKRFVVTPQSLGVLDKMEQVKDPQGKSYFLAPDGMSAEDMRKAAVMTYIFNCGTDYGEGTANDIEPTPYSANEVQRVIDRQSANAWSYENGVPFVDANGGRLMTTPNGMLMGLGGSPLQDVFSEDGGSTYGDIFMFNIDDPDDAAQTLLDVVTSGVQWYPQPDGNGAPGSNNLGLDRLLHHEEMHSAQWQALGREGFIAAYAAGAVLEWWKDVPNPLEVAAGSEDGGY
jgi:EspA/EspE family